MKCLLSEPGVLQKDVVVLRGEEGQEGLYPIVPFSFQSCECGACPECVPVTLRCGRAAGDAYPPESLWSSEIQRRQPRSELW